jgi:hypothetical protein
MFDIGKKGEYCVSLPGNFRDLADFLGLVPFWDAVAVIG